MNKKLKQIKSINFPELKNNICFSLQPIEASVLIVHVCGLQIKQKHKNESKI